ncbi:beta-phosphoglucomutase [Pectobacterium parmentieri]|uniref:beta-phosphoglucomutase n=1 Tax=Pectobacterium parmentieri TaxID=1905730 RepID=UPI0001B0D082|nr:beta-phosphoglucomutase [Pectobacterium parmentieri]ACX86586.1 beta-phosphoglucomutase [Pectobacterium parmentieri WPP163]MBI0550855.1 beta-phosphoglucomutase [Pectobacterium parmentieri]MBI0559871.1 beta-phosphoglucomutase [Pectobacterium parmentieri]MBI0563759.1 beta-phosphoglucomutase [Pectobacterium parmentieri]QQA75319.1 beta-phosphoglucomutase [Pectobacterium parmentieri]
MNNGFLFDLDGVIVDTAHYHFIAWKHLANKIGIDIDEEFNETLKGISREGSLERILQYGGKLNEFDHNEKVKLAKEKNDYYVNTLNQLTEKDILPGVLLFIKRAKELGIPCAIASASKNAKLILEKLKIIDYFQHIVDPDTLKRGKPDPEIFLKAAKSIGVEPHNAVGFEDAPAGIVALNKAKIFSVGIAVKQESLIGANVVVPSLNNISPEMLLQQKNR